MKNKLGLVLMNLALLLVLAVGPVVSDLAAREAESPVGTAKIWNGPQGILVSPMCSAGTGGCE
jgi:hypothetical protein